MTGPIKVVIYAHSDAPNSDFTAKLIDVHPNGKAYNLCDGIIRTDFTQGLAEPQKLEISLGATSNVFKVGHKIRLDISSSNFPRFDRNPNTGERACDATRFVTAQQKIFHGGKYSTKIILPVIPSVEQNAHQEGDFAIDKFILVGNQPSNQAS